MGGWFAAEPLARSAAGKAAVTAFELAGKAAGAAVEPAAGAAVGSVAAAALGPAAGAAAGDAVLEISRNAAAWATAGCRSAFLWADTVATAG